MNNEYGNRSTRRGLWISIQPEGSSKDVLVHISAMDCAELPDARDV